MTEPSTLLRSILYACLRQFARRVGRQALGILCLSLIAGCGYSLVGSPPDRPGGLTVVIPPVINQAREPGLEHRMTAALRRAVVNNPRLKLASEPAASHHLQGTVLQFRIFAVSFDASDNVVQYRIESNTRIRLVKRTGKTPTLDQTVTAWSEYLVSPEGSVRENVAARTAAITRLAEQFADKCTALIDVVLL